MQFVKKTVRNYNFSINYLQILINAVMLPGKLNESLQSGVSRERPGAM